MEKFLSKNAGHRPVSLPGMLLFWGCFSRILLVETGYVVFLYISNFIFYFIYNFIISFKVILTYFKKHLRVSRTIMESGVGLSMTKVNDSLLYFVAERAILDFVVVLGASRDINCLYRKYPNLVRTKK